MTSSEHQSGTDRIAEVAKQIEHARFVLNVQGDEPFIQPKQLELVVNALQAGATIATLAHAIENLEELLSPDVVKLTKDKSGRALYFSRSPIPYPRDLDQDQWIGVGAHFRHLGLYGFSRQTLLELTELPTSTLERTEKLEQLRWLQAGYFIQIAVTDQPAIGIDTPEDLAAARRLFFPIWCLSPFPGPTPLKPTYYENQNPVSGLFHGRLS